MGCELVAPGTHMGWGPRHLQEYLVCRGFALSPVVRFDPRDNPRGRCHPGSFRYHGMGCLEVFCLIQEHAGLCACVRTATMSSASSLHTRLAGTLAA